MGRPLAAVRVEESDIRTRLVLHAHRRANLFKETRGSDFVRVITRNDGGAKGRGKQ